MSQTASITDDRFEFGKNWKNYIEKHFSQERVEISKRHMLDFLGVERLDGKTFLDIGCGSGLHSLAAIQAGAARVVSFDYDPQSVETTRFLKRHAGDPTHWTVQRGSVLDRAFMATLAPADIVYSWGVLHHTGDVWTAFRNAVERIGEHGTFYVALYSANVQVNPPPEFWLDVKRRYNASSALGKRAWELWYIWRFSMNRRLWALPGVLKHVFQYKKSRGMSFYTDIKDWLGGWPMEFCRDEDVAALAKELGLEQTKIATGHANTEFLFVRPA